MAKVPKLSSPWFTLVFRSRIENRYARAGSEKAGLYFCPQRLVSAVALDRHGSKRWPLVSARFSCFPLSLARHALVRARGPLRSVHELSLMAITTLYPDDSVFYDKEHVAERYVVRLE